MIIDLPAIQFVVRAFQLPGGLALPGNSLAAINISTEENSKKLVTLYRFQKPCFANDIEQFWKKIYDEPGVKNCKLFEGVSPSFCNLARRIENPKIAHRSEQSRGF